MNDGTDNTTQSSEKEGDGDDQSLYLQEQADVIHDLAGMLVHDVSGDDRFWRFQAMAFHAANAFGDVPDMNLFEFIRSEEGRTQLLSNPAAAPLLAYCIYALQRFNWDVAEDELADAKTEERCRMLARAFSLLGQQGERRPQFGKAGYFSLEFGEMILQVQKGLGLPAGVNRPGFRGGQLV